MQFHHRLRLLLAATALLGASGLVGTVLRPERAAASAPKHVVVVANVMDVVEPAPTGLLVRESPCTVSELTVLPPDNCGK